MSARGWVAVATLVLGGCQAFPDIASGECGNRVVEAGEDCDSFALHGNECRSPQSIGGCHFDCSQDETGARHACPPGFGCDESFVCRREMGTFDAVQNPVPGGYGSLEMGDFDGDRRADVVGLDPRGGRFGVTHLDVHYYDQRGQPSASYSLTVPITGAATFDRPGDGVGQGLVVAAQAFGVLLGERDDTLSPDVRPSYFLEANKVAIVPFRDRDVELTTPLMVFVENGGAVEVNIPDTESALLNKIAELPHTLDELAPPARGALFSGDEHPCDEVVLAVLGTRELSAYQMCVRDPATGWVTYRSRPLVTKLALPDGAVVDGAPLVVDLDGDDQADLLVRSERGLYAAFGDGASLSLLTPFEISELHPHDGSVSVWNQLKEPIRPLAAGDFTGDGRADLVDPGGLLVSVDVPVPGNVFRRAHANAGAPWSEARIADLTGDGRLDVVACSMGQTDLDVFMGTDSDRPNPLAVPTTHPAARLTIGDYDADQISDVGFMERGTGPSAEDEFLVAFGGSFSSLLSPARGGHLGGVWDLVAIPDDIDDVRDNLAIIHGLTLEDGTTGGAMSIVQGDAHRTFVSPVQLDALDAEGVLQQAEALLVTTGHFRDAAITDVLSLAYHRENEVTLEPGHPELWLLPNLGSRASTPGPVGWPFDPRLVPAVVDEMDPQVGTVFVSLSAGDLNGDGLDEAVLAGPVQPSGSCLLAPVGLSGQGSRPEPWRPVELDEPCVAAPALRVADLDGDGAGDLVLATGGVDVEGRIVVLWNDGAGGFDAAASTTLVPREEAPRAFAVYPTRPGKPARLAYVSEHAARVLESRGQARDFTDLGRVAELSAATGIAAGDVNGDGLVDLAVADAGWIQLFLAAVTR